MESERPKLQNIMEDGLGKDLMNAGRFCFSCEQIFATRICLENHVCFAATYICSCGTEFIEYKNMLEHSTTHEPGHQVLNHDTIKKRRFEKRAEEEAQLKRLQTGEVVWKPPNSDKASLIPLPEVHMQPAHIPQVPGLNTSLSTTLLPNQISSSSDMKNIFAGVGAPTVDLWTIYQPVVLLETVRKFNKNRPYTCIKCDQCFETKTSLVSHHSTHVADKVSGCIGCGLLLSSKKVVPRFHICNSPSTATKFRLITAKPQSTNVPNVLGTNRTLNVSGQATSFMQLNRRNPSKWAPHGTPAMSQINLNLKTYTQKSKEPRAIPPLQLKTQNPNASKPYVTFSTPVKSLTLNPNALNKSSRGTPTNFVFGASSTLIPKSSASGVFNCRICHLPFETMQMLQRHKCAKAREFMAQHMLSGKQHNKLKRMTPVAIQNPVKMNSERKFWASSSGNVMKNQVMAVSLNEGPRAVTVSGKTGADADDDCYIVESGPDKPAEMIYQLTSSVPITT